MEKENTYILKGDVSGIQNFIYNVYQGQGGIAKILRARSFLISVIPYAALKFLKDSLEENFPGKYKITPDPDVESLSEKFIINEGGGFTAEIKVKSSDKEFENFIENFKLSLENFFIKELQGELGLTIAYEKSDKSESFSKIYNLLETSKKRKFLLYLKEMKEEPPILDKAKNRAICPVCRTFFKEESEEMCSFCQKMRNLGEKLTKYSDFTIKNSNGKNKKGQTEEEVFLFKFGNRNYSLTLNSSSEQGNQRLVTVPVISKFLKNSEIQELERELGIEKPIPGTIAPFELIAKASRGDSKLGYLTVDIDNLGLVFPALKEKGIRKFLSKSLNEFFSFQVPDIALKEFKPSKIEIRDKKLQLLEETLIYILYSGGDDLFAIGPWDKIIDFAIAVNKKFSEFKQKLASNKSLKTICHLINNLTLSAGLAVVKPKFTVRVAAEWCKEAEDQSKSSGKNRVSLFGETLKWEHFESTVKDAKCWSNLIEEGKIPRRFIYRFYKLYLDLIYYPKKFKQTKNLEFYPRIYYLIARTLDENYKSLATSLVEKTLNENKFGVKIFCNYVLTATRGR